MQRKSTKGLITPAEYARLRGLNRSTISRQIRNGQIPTRDGLIDPRAADAARERNLDASRRLGAEISKRGRAALKKAAADKGSAGADEVHAAVVRAVTAIASPEECLRFARVALAVGCSPEQAFALASLHIEAVTLAVEDVEVEDLEGCPEPDESAWRRTLGPFSVDEADSLHDRASAQLSAEA